MAESPLWKCECNDCNCENAAVKEDQDFPPICYSCSQGIHRAEREWREASEATRERIAKEEKDLKDRED